ncbi:MAG: hypothetical protein LUE08_05385 [Akkermansiaceae bacterium]|nr:hypothetical protein [Akkermansiaceae bacterium]
MIRISSLLAAVSLIFCLPAAARAQQTPPPPPAAPQAADKPCLNIVYFLGNDLAPIPGYEERLSALMLHLQDFFQKEMARNGYPNRTLSLDMKTPDRVNIILYKAQGAASDYPYTGNWPRVIQELDAYFSAHPGMKKSNHTLIIMPTFYNDEYNDANPGGVPFYGVGKSCFALDYADFDIKHLGARTPQGRLLTKWYGGLAHELGHGLNLPHNHQTTSDGAKLGTPLMGAGNYTFGSSPTYLTPASCAILNVCEVFAGDTSTEFYKTPAPKLDAISISLKGNKLVINGSYTGQEKASAVNIYVQDPPYQVNADYDSVSFTQKLGKKSGNFSFHIPRRELHGLRSDTFRITVRLLTSSGNWEDWHHEFHWSDLPPFSQKFSEQ